MAKLPEQSPRIAALHAQWAALDRIASLSRRLSRRFGAPGSEQDWANYLDALKQEQVTRRAYQDSMKSPASAARRAVGEDGR
jgi:predicted HD phosphohydrolase